LRGASASDAARQTFRRKNDDECQMGLGLRCFSVVPTEIFAVKNNFRSITLAEAEKNGVAGAHHEHGVRGRGFPRKAVAGQQSSVEKELTNPAD
jgi:hypothetical protein